MKNQFQCFTASLSFHCVYIETSCSCPPAPTNGSRNCSGSNEVAAYSRLYYKCNSGYHVVGDEYRTCHPSGNWTGSTPVCVEGTYECLLTIHQLKVQLLLYELVQEWNDLRHSCLQCLL